ncbi:MAG: RNA methyltransferase [Clostridia bacterium]|nr:RNA methyltransferase [Clostridia bacterium]
MGVEAGVITSLDNPKVKLARSLKSRRGREKAGRFLLEGPKFIAEGLDYGWPIQYVLVAEAKLAAYGQLLERLEASGIPMVRVRDGIFNVLSDTVHSQGLIAVANKSRASWDSLVAHGRPSLVVIGDRLQDPGNLGTIIRTAAAVGADALILTSGSCDPFNEKCVRASAGAVLRLPIVEGEKEEELAGKLSRAGLGLAISAPQAKGALPPWGVDLLRPTALVLGNEGQGVSPYLMGRAEVTIGIPLAEGLESLNVATAASMILYEAWRQRHLAPAPDPSHAAGCTA